MNNHERHNRFYNEVIVLCCMPSMRTSAAAAAGWLGHHNRNDRKPVAEPTAQEGIGTDAPDAPVVLKKPALSDSRLVPTAGRRSTQSAAVIEGGPGQPPGREASRPFSDPSASGDHGSDACAKPMALRLSASTGSRISSTANLPHTSGHPHVLMTMAAQRPPEPFWPFLPPQPLPECCCGFDCCWCCCCFRPPE